MKVVTVIDDTEHFGFNLLRLSCALNGLELIVLVSKGSFYSNRIKDDLLADYLEEVENDEIILFTDGNDTVFMSDQREILSKFKNFDKNLIFSAEMECWPDINLADQYPSIENSRYKYLNSGAFIGKVGLIKELLKDDSLDLENFPKSNQYLWAKRYFKNTDKIALDINCQIFLTLSPQVGFDYLPGTERKYLTKMEKWFKSNFAIVDGRIYNKITSTKACHAHFNGKSKWLVNEDIVKMIYNNFAKQVQFFFEA
jgi:hypothetical protein